MVNAYRKSIPDSSDTDEITAELKKLKQWHQEGLITDEEYKTKKKELLDQ